MSVRSTFQIILGSLKNYLMKNYERKRPKHEPTYSKFYLARHISKCMMRADALNLHVYPVRTEMTATKQITASHVCYTNKRKLK